MAKISEKEYHILKSLDEKWKWIARDKNGYVYIHDSKPHKFHLPLCGGWEGDSWMDINGDFSFIQWEDDEPYNIQELIDEYEKEYQIKNAKIVKLDANKLAGNASDYKHFYKRVGESEETEVKKDIEWLKDEILTDMRYLEGNREIRQLDIKYQTLREVAQKINSLDEPEVLSEEWIDEKSFPIIHQAREKDVVPVKDLQNLLVPKQEEVDQAYKDGYEKGKQHTFYKGYLEGLADKESETETVADVIADFYKSRERLKEVLGTKVEELEEWH